MLIVLFAGVVILFDNRVSLIEPSASGHPPKLEEGLEAPIKIVTVVALVILGWAIARDFGRGLAPRLFRRLDPSTAGTVGFLMRYFKTRTLMPFAVYCLVFGPAMIIYTTS